MQPIDALRAGLEILDPVMRPHGFRCGVEETGHGSGGDFARGEYARGDRRLELHFRYSLGLVTYHVGDTSLGHEAYMRALGVPPGAAQYPGFSDGPRDGFRHLAHDLRLYGAEFLSGDAAVLRATAPVEASRRAAEWRKEAARYAGDRSKRDEARRLFRAGEYARVVALLESLQDPDLLSAAEQKALSVARRRASAG